MPEKEPRVKGHLQPRNGETIDPDQVQLRYDAQRAGWEEALLALQRSIRMLLEKHGYTPTVKYRVKRFPNYFEKLARLGRGRKNAAPPLVNDLLGLRIVCPFLEDIDAVEALITEHFPVIEVERKGKQHSFREFGYDSVHLLVQLEPEQVRVDLPRARNVLEIQLRTTLQDAWAEVEHELVYKSNIALPKESVKRKLAALNAILTLSDLMFQEIRDFQKEIRKRDQKRRTALTGSFQVPDLISLCEADLKREDAEEDIPLATVVGAAGGRLEKAMLAALDAHSRGDLQNATELYSQILDMSLDPKTRALVFNHRGMACFVLGRYQDALQDFSRALECDVSNVRIYTNRGLTCRVLHLFERAVQDYDAAVALAPENIDGYWGRAQTYYEMGQLTRALSDCDRALSLQPDFAAAGELAKKLRQSLL